MNGLCDIIERATGESSTFLNSRSIGGGCIHNAQRVETDRGVFFVKLNDVSFLEAFQNEATALAEIAATNTIRAPRPIAADTIDGQACLVLEFIQEGAARQDSWEKMGIQLAALHSIGQPYFGWSRDNVIGSTPQPNPKTDDWIAFLRDFRLAHQFKLCAKRGYRFTGQDKLLNRVSDFFDMPPQPSLLHGDLWSGNASFDSNGEPFIYDPGSYYGDREADLAFTEFFGGFDRRFYQAYNEALPLEPGYEIRKHLYNLYHCLNHAYIFGSSYAGQAQGMIDRLLAELS